MKTCRRGHQHNEKSCPKCRRLRRRGKPVSEDERRYRAEWQRKNMRTEEGRSYHRKYQAAARRDPKKWASIRIHDVRARAMKRGIPFAITADDLVIPEFCPLLGIRIELGMGHGYAGGPSIDRIDPSKGYVPGNVWVISYRANTIKQDASSEELELIAKNLKAKMYDDSARM